MDADVDVAAPLICLVDGGVLRRFNLLEKLVKMINHVVKGVHFLTRSGSENVGAGVRAEYNMKAVDKRLGDGNSLDSSGAREGFGELGDFFVKFDDTIH